MAEHARLSTLSVAQDRIDEAIGFFRETDLEEAAAARGFRRAFWLLDRATGKGAEMVVFESREALEAAQEEEENARARARGVMIP